MIGFKPLTKNQRSTACTCLNPGEVLSAEQKISAIGEPYLQLKIGTWAGMRMFGTQLKERTCNRFFQFAPNTPFEEKLKQIGEFAQDYLEGAHCYCKMGLFQPQRGFPVPYVVEVYKTKEAARSANPNAPVY